MSAAKWRKRKGKWTQPNLVEHKPKATLNDKIWKTNFIASLPGLKSEHRVESKKLQYENAGGKY